MCFSLAWLEQIAIAVVVICVVLALLNLLVKFVVPKIANPTGQQIVQFIVSVGWILFWGAICVLAIVFIFDLIACLVGYIRLPALR